MHSYLQTGAPETDLMTRDATPFDIVATAPGAPLRVLGVDPERAFAGGETQVLALTMGLLSAGHRAELACDPTGRLFERASREGVVCRPLAIRNALDLGAAMRLRKLLASEHYDVVHFHTSRAHSMAPFARGLGRALIVTRRMDYRPNRLFAPYLYNRAVDAVAAISTGVAAALKDSGVASDHISIIASGVDCDHFRPADSNQRQNARARLGIGPDDFAIGSVGMLEERKGHRYLLEAIAELKRTRPALARVKCVIAGDGALRATFTKLAAELSISDDTMFPGMVADSRAVLDALDLFVFPSLKEGLGVALLEAMACGLPAVASRTGGVIDIIDAEVDGVLVPPGDSHSIASAIATLINNRARRSELGETARRRVMEHFSTAAMTRKTIDLYRASLAKREVIF